MDAIGMPPSWVWRRAGRGVPQPPKVELADAKGFTYSPVSEYRPSNPLYFVAARSATRRICRWQAAAFADDDRARLSLYMHGVHPAFANFLARGA
jgi:hypothetical protein